MCRTEMYKGFRVYGLTGTFLAINVETSANESWKVIFEYNIITI